MENSDDGVELLSNQHLQDTVGGMLPWTVVFPQTSTDPRQDKAFKALTETMIVSLN